jgi:hypothetical protein
MTALALILGITIVVAVVVVVLVEAFVAGGANVHDDAPTVDGGWRQGV